MNRRQMGIFQMHACLPCNPGVLIGCCDCDLSYSSGFSVKSGGMIAISHRRTTFFTSSTKTVADILNLESCMIFLATIHIKRKKEGRLPPQRNYNVENTAKDDSRDQDNFQPYSIMKILLKMIPEIRIIPRCVFVMLLVFSILYEMRNDMLPKIEIKIKRAPADIRSICESSSRFLFAYATRM